MSRYLRILLLACALQLPMPAMAGWVDGIPTLIGNIVGPMVSDGLKKESAPDYGEFERQNDAARQELEQKLAQAQLGSTEQEAARTAFEESMDKPAFAKAWPAQP